MRPPSPSAPTREPAFNLPPVILVFIAAILAIQGLREVLDDVSDLKLVLDFGFIPAQWAIAFGWTTPDAVIAAASGGTGGDESRVALATLARYVVEQGSPQPLAWLSYALLHGSWTHVGLNSVWLAAFGSPVARRAGLWRTILLAIVTGIGGALAQLLVSPLSPQPMIGASAIVSGFMAAAATFIFRRQEAFGRGRERETRYGFLSNRNALLFLASWFAANLLFGLAAGTLGISEGAIAWEAHIGGLLAGLILFPLVDPGPERRW